MNLIQALFAKRQKPRAVAETKTETLPHEFNEIAYLEAHSDVRAAVVSGGLESGAAHYLAYGQREGRALRLTMIETIDELDIEIERLLVLQKISFSAWLRGRASFRFRENVAALPQNPLSDAYRETQLNLYSKIAGVSEYNPWKAEPIQISVKDSIDPYPFPYNTQDGELIGGHMAAVGQILRTLWEVKPSGGHSLLEYGCGTGFSTLNLAASGYKVTAVDINADALAVIDAMSTARGLKVTTFNGEFGDAPDENQKFDFILFYESFHHCLDFVSLLRRLHKRIAQNGALVFAGEPITEDFPKPWGLRLDGASLWEIRTRGWLELGFQEKFFMQIMSETGWKVQKRTFPGLPDMFIATQSDISAA